MANFKRKPPSYRRHKASGQAIVTLSGKDFYLGPYGTRVSRDNYDRRVAEWLVGGRTLPSTALSGEQTVVELANAFRKAEVAPPGSADDYMTVMKIMVRLYGRLPVSEFGPLALKVVRDEMVKAGWKRQTVNQRVHYLRRIFRWAVEHQLIPADQFVALKAVEPLRAGRTVAPESNVVGPVDRTHVEICIAHATPTVRAMVRVQMFTGMRAGEMVQMRTGDIDMSDPECWVYRPQSHKNKHRGHFREIPIGKRGQAALEPYLLPDLSAFVFSPSRADAERRAARSERRVTPMNQGNRPGSRGKTERVTPPGEHYTTDTYRRAIEYATRQAFPDPPELARQPNESTPAMRLRLGPAQWAAYVAHRKAHHWHPHQLRHTFATIVANQFSQEHAQRSLGHASIKATAIYAKLSLDKAKEVQRAIG